MVTTGELRAIIEELQLIDIGDAASYLGEEAMVGEEALVSAQAATLSVPITIEDVNGIVAFSIGAQ
jgi:hypothetical protein